LSYQSCPRWQYPKTPDSFHPAIGWSEAYRTILYVPPKSPTEDFLAVFRPGTVSDRALKIELPVERARPPIRICTEAQLRAFFRFHIRPPPCGTALAGSQCRGAVGDGNQGQIKGGDLGLFLELLPSSLALIRDFGGPSSARLKLSNARFKVYKPGFTLGRAEASNYARLRHRKLSESSDGRLAFLVNLDAFQ
jgi:hypothetical protein